MVSVTVLQTLIPICHENIFLLFINKLEKLTQITVVLIPAGKLVEYDEVTKLINREGSLFGQLVDEYWSRASNFTAFGD